MSKQEVITQTIEDRDPTTRDVLVAINQFSADMDEELHEIRGRLGKIENTMVTKDYLDEKLSDLRGDLVVLVRKEDNKVVKLVSILQERKVITSDDVESILAMELFPKTLKPV